MTQLSDRAESDPWPVISTTKLAAAVRQLDASIRLLFAKEEPLAVHTLAFASYGLLADLSGSRGPTATRLKVDAELWEGKEFWKGIKKLANADRDPGADITGIPEEINEAVLLTNCLLLREIDELRSPEQKALWLWSHALFFINVDDVPSVNWEWIDEFQDQLHAESRGERIEIGLALLEKLKNAEARSYRMDPEQILLPWRLVMQPTSRSKHRTHDSPGGS